MYVAHDVSESEEEVDSGDEGAGSGEEDDTEEEYGEEDDEDEDVESDTQQHQEDVTVSSKRSPKLRSNKERHGKTSSGAGQTLAPKRAKPTPSKKGVRRSATVAVETETETPAKKKKRKPNPPPKITTKDGSVVDLARPPMRLRRDKYLLGE